MTDLIDGQPAIVSAGELERVKDFVELAATRAATIALDEARADMDSVRFGDDQHQTLTADWAELVLRELYTHHRTVFADCLAGAFAEVRKTKPGPRAKKEVR